MVTDRKALVVGINEYDRPRISDLQGCIVDANTIKELLENHQDTEVGKNFHVDKYENLRTADLKEAIVKFLQGNQELALIYFAGHGFIDENKGYLMCKDASIDCIGVEMGWLNDRIKESEIKEVIIILDCCHSGHFGNIQGKNTEFFELRKGVSILAASTKDQYSEEVREEDERGKLLPQGLFTKIISEGLRGAAADINGNVTIPALYRHADESLSVIQQRPVYKSFVDKMTSLRFCRASISRKTLKRIISKKGFSTIDDEKIFFPSDIPKNENQEALNAFVLVSKFEKAGLIECDNQMTLIEAALRNKSCRLNMKGRFIWNKVKNDNY